MYVRVLVVGNMFVVDTGLVTVAGMAGVECLNAKGERNNHTAVLEG
jgi:hypothetical protein